MAPAYANATTRTEPATPVTGQPIDLHLSLYDGATGRVLDDLRPEHAALVHLALVSDDRGTFAHVHPARFGPGEYLVRLTCPSRAATPCTASSNGTAAERSWSPPGTPCPGRRPGSSPANRIPPW